MYFDIFMITIFRFLINFFFVGVEFYFLKLEINSEIKKKAANGGIVDCFVDRSTELEEFA